MASTALHESFRTAYGFWRGAGPRGNALLSFAHELAKLPAFNDEASSEASAPEASPLVAAVLVLDEAWRRQYAASEVTEETLEELLSAAHHGRMIRPAPGGPQPSPEGRLLGRRVELDRVRLARPVPAFYEPGEAEFSTDRKLPAGASGTVMLVLDEGQGYEVEFAEPFAAIATVQDADLI